MIGPVSVDNYSSANAANKPRAELEVDLVEILPQGEAAPLAAGEIVVLPTEILSLHEAASIISLMAEDQFAVLLEDVREHGVREPVTLVLEGRDSDSPALFVVDGRHRLQCVKQLGYDEIPARLMVLVEEMTIEEVVVSLNQRRRRLRDGQKALSAARLKRVFEVDAAVRQRAGRRHAIEATSNDADADQQGRARDLAGREFGISGKTVDYGAKVLDRGISELETAVEAAVLSVSKAAELAEALLGEEHEEPLRELLTGTPKEVRDQVAEFLRQRAAWTTFNEGRNGHSVVIEGGHLDEMVFLRQAIDKHIEKLSRMESWALERVEQPAGRLLAPSKVLTSINTLKKRLNEARPYELCPGCAEQKWRGCDLCEGTGWLGEGEYKEWAKGSTVASEEDEA